MKQAFSLDVLKPAPTTCLCGIDNFCQTTSGIRYLLHLVYELLWFYHSHYIKDMVYVTVAFFNQRLLDYHTTESPINRPSHMIKIDILTKYLVSDNLVD